VTGLVKYSVKRDLLVLLLVTCRSLTSQLVTSHKWLRETSKFQLSGVTLPTAVSIHIQYQTAGYFDKSLHYVLFINAATF